VGGVGVATNEVCAVVFTCVGRRPPLRGAVYMVTGGYGNSAGSGLIRLLTRDLRSPPRDASCMFDMMGMFFSPASCLSALSSLVAMMTNAMLEREFEDGSGQDQVQAMRRWVVAETDVEAVDQTVDRVPAGADHEE